jgi:DNA mismatch repair ATPase MutS
MTENTIKNVNFDYIFNELKTITEYGLKVKQEAKIFVKGQEADLKTEFNKIRAFIENRQRRDIIDVLKHIKNILETIERAKSNQVLDEVELFEIKNFLILIEKTDKILRGISATDIKLLKLTPLPQLYEKLDPAHEKLNTFYIYDEYSQKLKEIRSEKRQIEKTIRQLKKKIKEEVQGKHNIKLNLKDEATISKSQKERIDELNKEAYLRVSGENYLNIIYKIKNTDEIDKLQKKFEELAHEEDDEEYKIRQEISGSIKEFSDILQKNTETIGEIDYLIAKANYAQKTNSVEPEITNELQITIKGGRNLKLEKTLKDKHIEYVPIDLALNKNVVCITGANMGGKTVTLRMTGQLAAMASYGMFVPCEYAKLCLFEHIFISAGDDQSIEKGLSTFGAEIVNLKEAIKNSESRSLILIDELAGGTNPKEGYAITKALVNYLKNKDCITVLTTHYDNVANDEDIQNLRVKGLKFPDEADLIKHGGIEHVQKYMD